MTFTLLANHSEKFFKCREKEINISIEVTFVIEEKNYRKNIY